MAESSSSFTVFFFLLDSAQPRSFPQYDFTNGGGGGASAFFPNSGCFRLQ